MRVVNRLDAVMFNFLFITKRVICGLDLVIFHHCFFITKRFQRVVNRLDTVMFTFFFITKCFKLVVCDLDLVMFNLFFYNETF